MFHFLTTDAASGLGTSAIMMIGMLALMYFMLIRPENKRKKKEEEMRAALKAGDSITTIGGVKGVVVDVKGVVVDVKEDRFVLETGADRVRIEFAKFALSENHTASERAIAENKKAKEQAAKDKAAKKAAK